MVSEYLALRALCWSALAVGPVYAQQFVDNVSDIPLGAPNNLAPTANIDFADVDLDGDFDAALADGNDALLAQNRLWINQGPGTGLGAFVDETAARFPLISDQSRDIEFVDFDGDGDPDIYTSQTSQSGPQTNRWWHNVGAGVYTDETQTRWVNVGVNDGSTTFSSIAPAVAFPGGGGFLDWSCDCDFGDLDNDGDLDLVHSSYGGSFSGDVPTRLFLNDGTGHFEEFNPSGHQFLSTFIQNGDPGLWCEGTQQHETLDATGANCDIALTGVDVDVADLDGDLDLDLLHGARNDVPRMFYNRLEENGGAPADLGFRDVSAAVFPASWSTGFAHYEQEMGDLDNDGDLDIYGVNWQMNGVSFDDVVMENLGNGTFGPQTLAGGSGGDDIEADFIDFDNDGDLDVYVGSFSLRDRVYRNDTAGGGITLTLMAPSAVIPDNFLPCLDPEVVDVDLDGDYDVMLAIDNGSNVYFENLLDPAGGTDGHAPNLHALEQAPDRDAGPAPTVIRVQVYDNAPYYVVYSYQAELTYTVDGGPAQVVAMRSSGGQIFRGEIPGNVTGTICYSVSATDTYGQTGTTGVLCFDATNQPTVYCTAKTSSAGCIASISTSNPAAQPVSGAGGYEVVATNVQGFKNGLVFASLSGAAALPFNGGTLCMFPPTKRGPIQSSVGTGPVLCDGSFATLVNDGAILPAGLDAGTGNSAWYQYWYRDPQNGAGQLGTSLSNAVQLDFE